MDAADTVDIESRLEPAEVLPLDVPLLQWCHPEPGAQNDGGVVPFLDSCNFQIVKYSVVAHAKDRRAAASRLGA